MCVGVGVEGCVGSTFSWISCVDWASQKATVATSFRMGISTVQSRPSSRATRGRGCIGPFRIGGRIPESRGKNECWLWHMSNKYSSTNTNLREKTQVFISTSMQWRLANDTSTATSCLHWGYSTPNHPEWLAVMSSSFIPQVDVCTVLTSRLSVFVWWHLSPRDKLKLK